MNIEDVALYRPVIGSAISSDGRFVAAVTPRYEPRTGQRPPVLLLRDLDGPATVIELATDDGVRELYAPSFSPDGRRLAALADDHSGQRAVLFELLGKKPKHKLLRGVPAWPRALGWRGYPGAPACLGDDPEGWRRVWVWPELGRHPVAVTPPGQHAGDYAFRPDGERLAWLSIPDLLDGDGEESTLYVSDGDGRDAVEVSVLGRPTGYLAWSPDGRWLAYLARRRGHRLSASRLWIVDPEAWPATTSAIHCLTRELDGWVTGFDWTSDGTGLIVAVVQGTAGRLVRIGLDGSVEAIGPRDTYLSGVHTDRSRGRMIFLHQDIAQPQRLMLADPGRPSRLGRPLLQLNRRLSGMLHEGEAVTWTADDGTRLDGVLVRPASDRPCPLLVWLHGGPADHVARTFSPYFQVFASAGYAVFAPNYRGSTGRDEPFMRAPIRDLGGQDAADVLSGVDRLVQMGVADPIRTAAVGWSYGGTLALTLASRSDLFHALVVGAPVVDWVGFFGAPRFPALLREYFGAPFWEDRRPYDEASPITHVAQIRVPTLIVQGGRDPMVPLSQGRLLYRALTALDVPADLMEYPHEGHIPVAPEAVADMLERILRWLATHLLPPDGEG